tara:strand:- start:10054 stop:10932 length:879 start_codon:yes stop_codon:yes gene_type:complete
MALVVYALPVTAQDTPRFLRPAPKAGQPIVPLMEGWYGNADGSVTVSFGYWNRDEADIIIPMGDANRIEPAQLGGMQPEVYFSGRHHGVFTVTIPASMGDETIWWHLKTGNSAELKVPGERGSNAYELDRNPRPQGSVQPLIWFEADKPGSGPEGVVSSTVRTAVVGVPLTLEVGTDDPSVRDTSDPAFAKPLDTRVVWYKHQGPGEVLFTEDPSTPFMTTFRKALGRLTLPNPLASIAIPGSKGPARVRATFSEPGEYMIRARLDNWNAAESTGFHQCCWSHGFQRVRVTP